MMNSITARVKLCVSVSCGHIGKAAARDRKEEDKGW